MAASPKAGGPDHAFFRARICGELYNLAKNQQDPANHNHVPYQNMLRDVLSNTENGLRFF